MAHFSHIINIVFTTSLYAPKAIHAFGFFDELPAVESSTPWAISTNRGSLPARGRNLNFGPGRCLMFWGDREGGGKGGDGARIRRTETVLYRHCVVPYCCGFAANILMPPRAKHTSPGQRAIGPQIVAKAVQNDSQQDHSQNQQHQAALPEHCITLFPVLQTLKGDCESLPRPFQAHRPHGTASIVPCSEHICKHPNACGKQPCFR